MPIYEYRCGACGQHVELLVRTSGVTPSCPDCGRLLTDKLFSVPNVLRGRRQQPTSHTCCGQEERCDAPPCSCGDECRHS